MLTDARHELTTRAARVRLAGVAALLVLAALLEACFYVQAAAGQADLMRRRQPIESVIARADTPDEVRTRLAYAREARDFAAARLGLPDNGSYRSYAEVGRPYVTWNVFAAPELDVQPKTWCFPIAGCVAYRGYFDERKAIEYAARLGRRGYDVYVGPVPAYSTLGHFDDPVLDTMLRYDDLELAALIFHELAHQVVFAPSATDFNEAFATTVELEGLRRWLESRGESAELQRFAERRKRQQTLAQALLDTRAELEALYAAPAAEAAKRAGKQAAFVRLRERLEGFRQEWSVGAAFDDFLASGFNNARLNAVAAYESCVPAFQRLLAGQGGDLPRFYAAVRQIASDAATRQAHCR